MSDSALFRVILKRSWQLLWKRPSMWILAFFATAVAGMGVIDAFLGAWRVMTRAAAPSVDFVSYQGSTIWTWLTPPYDLIYLPVFALIFIAVSVLFFFISVISLGALIRASVDKKEHTISSSWKYGLRHMWDLAGLVILRKAVIFFLLFISVIVGSWLFRMGTTAAAVLSVFSVLFFILAIVVISFLTVYAEAAVVIDRLSFTKSIRKSIQVFHDHVLLSLEMAIVMFIAEFAFAALGAIVLAIVAMPVFMLYIVSGITGASAFFIFGLVIMLLVMAALAFLLPAWSIMFSISSWSYLYAKVRKGKVKSRFLHFFGH